MTSLIAAALTFLGIHLAVSGTRLRNILVGQIGEKLYIPLFALASLAAIIWLCIAYNTASHAPSNNSLFSPIPIINALGPIVIASAFALAVPGILRGNPTSSGQETARISGILRVTRHPFLMGVCLWAAFHIVAKGTLAAAMFFGTFLILAVFGTRAIDRKSEHRHPAAWQDIASQTSVVPFAAIVEKRNRFVTAEIGDWRMSIAALVFGLLLALHAALFGASPFPVDLSFTTTTPH